MYDVLFKTKFNFKNDTNQNSNNSYSTLLFFKENAMEL